MTHGQCEFEVSNELWYYSTIDFTVDFTCHFLLTCVDL